ncbi:hypothetical protein PGH12_14040 [Chryseobacterium wangxinyae]|uniref:hypothetical protein n=1 Tax=Chryseobacterium sp. CY350 TaxID=2997336 RepID=UPI00226F9865|nr:hypothetical protein [Chryseobacterium sp. CY350]MCY0975805.1 hypothetical protein [Chryseobacterium sp. CY350]WBZ94585.1 hypothetical protein PGH12_14040 [Chryseobacterium sp. CY350]
MKKIAFLIFASLIFLLNSCKDEAAVYEGQSYLHFNKGVSSDAAVTGGTGSNTVNIEFGTITPVSGASQVKLVVDTSVSTAVEGTDFQIINQNTTVNAGEIGGKFQVKLLESGATLTPKLIVFKLQSSSIPNATFDQTYILTYKKVCPSALAGSYQYSTVNAFTPDGGSTTVPGPLTGSVVFTEVSAGVYAISDSSFGAFAFFPGYAATSTGVRIADVCGKLSFTTANQYGDTFTISNVVVNGNKLTFKWTTSYGETATTTLTKSNGNWPALY